MARANRHYIPGYVWHITHRCHKREFLLRFVRDRWSEGFVEHTKAALGIKAIGREVIEVIGEEGVYELRDPKLLIASTLAVKMGI